MVHLAGSKAALQPSACGNFSPCRSRSFGRHDRVAVLSAEYAERTAALNRAEGGQRLSARGRARRNAAFLGDSQDRAVSRPEPALAEKLALIEASGIAVLRLQDPRTGAAGQAPTQALPRAIGLRRPQAGLNRAGRTRSARIGQLAETYHASQRNPSQRDPKSA